MAKTRQGKCLPQNRASRSELEAVIARIERRPGESARHAGLRFSESENDTGNTYRAPLGIPEIDKVLDPQNASGIVTNTLHEVRVETGLAAAGGAGFALCLGLVMARHHHGRTSRCSRFFRTGEPTRAPDTNMPPVFWISDRYTRAECGRFYGPGLCAFGLQPDNLIRIHPQNREDVLWAAGEIAATPNAAAFCLMEINRHPREVDLGATRRLLLRTQASGTPVILLRQSGSRQASAATTRWQVEPASSVPVYPHANHAAVPLLHQFIGPPCFTVSLEKCRGGNADLSTKWTLEWNRDEQRLASVKPTLPHISRPAGTAPKTGREISHGAGELFAALPGTVRTA